MHGLAKDARGKNEHCFAHTFYQTAGTRSPLLVYSYFLTHWYISAKVVPKMDQTY